MDDCDYSNSSAPVLVFSDSDVDPTIRNAILGEKNCETETARKSDRMVKM